MLINHQLELIMKYFIILSIAISFSGFAKTEMVLPKGVYRTVPFSSQFLDAGALIRNVDYKAVNILIPQIEKYIGKKLVDRGESHISVITPPEGKGWSFSNPEGINALISQEELHRKYFSNLQKTEFKIHCLGDRISDSGNHVFFLVVDSPELFKVREEISAELKRRSKFAGTKVEFDPQNYYPHITVGYIGGDVHNVSKGKETCIKDITLVFK